MHYLDPANTLRLVSPEGTFTLQAKSEAERQEWVDIIHGVINCLLNTGKGCKWRSGV